MGSRAKGKRGKAVRAKPPEALVSADVHKRRVEYSDDEKRTKRPRAKPPAAVVSADVYRRLKEYSDDEKRAKRSAARPFGVIAMDAIERHAEVLASAWEEGGRGVPPPGGLFVRERHSHYRRHALPAKPIALQGVSPENAEILKKLKNQWGAGSVSDLVEQALRIELQI
jgi:hypothetical protein